jgi:HEAT repeat protein
MPKRKSVRRPSFFLPLLLLLASPAQAQTLRDEAWQLLRQGAKAKSGEARAAAVGVLGLLQGNIRAANMAEKALGDVKPNVRAAAATALGAMRSTRSASKLRDAMNDPEPTVALAAAHALLQLKDDAGYELYYAVLTGQRKSKKGLIAEQMEVLHDKKKMAQLGIEEGIGFIPFAGIGWSVLKMVRKDDTSPLRAAAARQLARDPDPASGDALLASASDKSWVVRAATLEAIALRGDTSLLPSVAEHMKDEKDIVRWAAAACVLRLSPVPKKK